MCAAIKGTSLLKDTQLQNYANLSPFNFVSPSPFSLSHSKTLCWEETILKWLLGTAVERTFHALEQHKEINIKQNVETLS